MTHFYSHQMISKSKYHLKEAAVVVLHPYFVTMKASAVYSILLTQHFYEQYSMEKMYSQTTTIVWSRHPLHSQHCFLCPPQLDETMILHFTSPLMLLHRFRFPFTDKFGLDKLTSSSSPTVDGSLSWHDLLDENLGLLVFFISAMREPIIFWVWVIFSSLK